MVPATLAIDYILGTTFVLLLDSRAFIPLNDYKKQQRKEKPEYVNNTYISGRIQQKKDLRDPPPHLKFILKD